MYLFVYHYERDDTCSRYEQYEIVSAFDWRTALIKLFDNLSKKVDVDIGMFEKMIKAVSDDDAVTMFNTISDYHIDKIYKNLEEFYTEPVVKEEV